MIYFFSGTGNSKWAATRLGELLGDAVANLMDPGLEPVAAGEAVGLVFPIYAWGPPKPVVEFVRRLQGDPAFRYVVCTCGENAGNAMELLRKDFPMDSAYSLAMPNNYVLGSQLESNEIVQEKFRRAKERLPEIAGEIQARKPCWQVEKGPQPRLRTKLIHPLFDRFATGTQPFFATEACVGCGLCVRNCPAHAITLVDGSPEWKGNCYLCTSCINRCPVQAIQYGEKTKGRGRYVCQEE